MFDLKKDITLEDLDLTSEIRKQIHLGNLVDDKEGIDTNPVDGDNVPASHFGVILTWEHWHALRDRLKNHDITFIIEPKIRFEGEPGEQATMFFLDPCGNALEFKSFKDDKQIFAT